MQHRFFIATKLEAFEDRGKSDLLLSHDMEDIVTVVDGRPSLLEEMRKAPMELQAYIAQKFGALLQNEDFLSALQGYLPGDAASQARLPLLEHRLGELANLV